MFDKSDILARLQNGETADAIAAAMSDALNDAQKAYDEEVALQKAEEARIKEEEAKRTAVMDAKKVAMSDVLGAICNYCLAAGYTELAEDLADLGKDDQVVEDLIQKVDEFAEVVKFLEKLENLEFKAPTEKKSCGSPSCACKTQPKNITLTGSDADAIIKTFLRGI